MPSTDVTLPNGRIAHRTRICGTKMDVYSLWEPSALCGPHGTIMSFGDRYYGRVGTRRISAELDALPLGPDRIAAVDAWYLAQQLEAYAQIREAFPEAARGRETYAEIEVVVE